MRLKGEVWIKGVIYEIKYTLYDGIYTDNTHKILKKLIDGNLYYVQYLLKIRQKSARFASHYTQHFNPNSVHTELCMYTMIKTVKQLNSI